MGNPLKIALVGAAGGIGSSLAYTLVLRGIGDEYLLVDPNTAVLETQVMDLEQLRGLGPFSVRAAEPAEIPSADIVVVSASVPPVRDLPRMDYLRRNLAITREIAEQFDGQGDWPGVVIMASNPVDPLGFDFQARTGIERHRVLGYSINDTLRLRYGIAEEVGVTPERVNAWAIGEHGNLCVPLFSRVEIDGVPTKFDRDQRQRILDYLLGWYPRWVALTTARTSTWTSGSGLAQMIDAIVNERRDPWPASFALDGEYGISGVAMSLPVQLGRTGVKTVLDWPLDGEEREGLARAERYLADIDVATA
jgi:malate dehydrogenase